jgi:hypothetical protein
MNHNEKLSMGAYKRAIAKLLPLGWIPVGIWLFKKGGRVFDLSAADVEQHERIEREGLFVV